ncbi:hypothetical protein [Lentzea sp. HUAS12]|uniref:rhamnogalacturonan endolyase family protein n=1 Tax=Lentzea sp. HUAS12 TaxID=2951806 RepID=UPI0020A0B91F|nr:hypothetical protein [Lentzea sp. HUAS12]USX53155.1 hypothetical protein ND450_03390 [Lentzea sp. HUAS12]
MDLRRSVLVPLVVTALLAGQPVALARPHGERLDRGPVAFTTPDGAYLSWRLLGHEATGATRTGLRRPGFAVYRDGRRIATVTGSTTYVDPGAAPGARYQVAPVVRGVPLGRSRAVTAWSTATAGPR